MNVSDALLSGYIPYSPWVVKRNVGIVPTSQSSKIHFLSAPVSNAPGVTNVAWHTNRSNICMEKVELESMELDGKKVEFVKGSVGKVKKVLEKVKFEGWDSDLYRLEEKLIGDTYMSLGTQKQLVCSRIKAMREADVDCKIFFYYFYS